MIARLRERTQPTSKPIKVDTRALEDEIKHFRELLSTSSLDANYSQIDWDVLARHFLHEDYHDYLNETHAAWEQRNKYLKRIEVQNPKYTTLEQYRKKCYDTFMKYWKDNNYVDHRKTENRISPSS